nr:MAG TPA: hypothetical protein [Caudoviricetes sp.]
MDNLHHNKIHINHSTLNRLVLHIIHLILPYLIPLLILFIL